MLAEAIEEYFIGPILTGTGYNPVNTFVYAVLLLALGYVVFRAIRALGIEVDSPFAMALFPYIALGSILRSLRDIGYFKTWLLVSPFLYIYVFSVTFLLLVISILVARKTKLPYQSFFFSFGFVISGILFTRLSFQNLGAALPVLGIGLLFFALIFAPLWKAPLWNKFVLMSQLFDASATYVALTFYGFGEQHVLPNLIFSLTGTVASFFLVKAAVALLMLWAVDTGIEDKNLANFLKLVVIVLGFAQGLRDLLMIVAFA
ncbi:MAG: DUF63 family protein [Candidatus Aenigmarchaeota archaeon]|nr:DUF63 family protein [Candidatus Aenigmarchaeota archaeon]